MQPKRPAFVQAGARTLAHASREPHMPIRPSSVWRHVLMLLPLSLTACGPSILDPKGFVGASEKTILIDSLAIMLAIVLPTIAATAAFAWWFRASNTRAVYKPDWAFSGQLEMLVWGIPLLTIMLLGGVAWIGSHELDPYKPLASAKPPLRIEAVSLDWKWLFIYPDQHIASVNQLTVPAGVPLQFALTSASVMNAFFIPELGSMIYTMNGMTTQLNLVADEPGVFYGRSSHYSGDGFSDMRFDVRAVPRDQFDAWVEGVRAGGPSLDSKAYAQLEQQAIDVKPFTYRDVSAGLFDQIVSLKLPPGPGPHAGAPDVNVSPRTEN